MPKTCILPQSAENLRNAFRTGVLSIEKLAAMKSSAERVAALEKYIGESAGMAVASLERAFLVPNTKAAIKTWFYNNAAKGIPLYKGITFDMAKQLDSMNIRDLRNMSATDRVQKLADVVGKEQAEDLNTKYENATKMGTVANWEKKTFGTTEIMNDKKLKGAFTKLENLTDLGALTPDQLEKYMETFVEESLGVNLSMDESKKLADLVTKQRDNFDALMKSGDWTFRNEKQVRDYFKSVKAVEDFSDSMTPNTPSKIVDNVVDIMRANILASPRILKNSFCIKPSPRWSARL